MKKLISIIALIITATLSTFLVKSTDTDDIKEFLKKHKIIASKSDLYYSYDQISKKYPWGLVVKKQDEYFVTDLDGNKLNERGFKRIGSFDEYGVAKVETAENFVGLMNNQGDLVAETLYDKIGHFAEDHLAIVEKRIPYNSQGNSGQIRYKSREGLVRRSGEFVVRPEYANITYLEDVGLYHIDYYFYQENLGSKESLFSARYGWLDNATYDSIGKFKDGLAIVKTKNHSGLINQDGSIVIPPIYRTVFEESEGLIRVDTERETAFFDVKGNIVLPFSKHRGGLFNYGVSIVHSPNRPRKVALMDKTGRFLSDYIYENIKPFKFYSELDQVLAIAEPLNSRFVGIIDTTGKFVIEPKYSQINYDQKGFFSTMTYVFSTDRSAATKKFRYLIDIQGNEYVDLGTTNPDVDKPEGIGKLGIVSQSRGVIAKPVYDDVRAVFSDTISVQQNELWGIINSDNDPLLPIKYQAINIISTSFAMVKQKGLWGVVNPQDNKVIVPMDYDALEYLSLTQINAKKHNKWRVIDI